MRRASVLLAGLLMAVCSHAAFASEPFHLVRLLFATRTAPEPISTGQQFDHVASQPVPAGDPAASPVDLSDTAAPFGLERQLRPIAARAPEAIAFSVRDGTARLGDYSIGSSEQVAGHLLVMRGDADVYGTLHGNLVTYAGNVKLHPGAHVDGSVLALRGAVRNEGATVGGKVQQVSEAALAPAPAAPTAPAMALLQNLAGVTGVLFSMILLAISVVLFAHRNLEVVSDTVVFSFGRAFVVGLLAQIVALPTFGMLVVGLVLTVVGVLLVPFVAVAFALLLIVGIVGGTVAALHAMGETRVRRRLAQGGTDRTNSYRYLQLGFPIPAALWLGWALFSQVRVAGPIMLGAAILATWCIATLGFGATLLSRAGIRANFAGRIIPAEALTDEYLWATPQFGVPAVSRSEAETRRGSGLL